jgi:hypothetical protein
LLIDSSSEAWRTTARKKPMASRDGGIQCTSDFQQNAMCFNIHLLMCLQNSFLHCSCCCCLCSSSTFMSFRRQMSFGTAMERWFVIWKVLTVESSGESQKINHCFCLLFFLSHNFQHRVGSP